MLKYWHAIWNADNDLLGDILGYFLKWIIIVCAGVLAVSVTVFLFRLMFL